MSNQSATSENDLSDFILVGGMRATIAYAYPIWSAQLLEMQLGKRTPGNFDPPISLELIKSYFPPRSKT